MTDREVYLYDMVVACEIATEDELSLAFPMTDMGWEDTLNRVVYIRTGYQTIEQYVREELMEEVE